MRRRSVVKLFIHHGRGITCIKKNMFHWYTPDTSIKSTANWSAPSGLPLRQDLPLLAAKLAMHDSS